MTQNTCCFTGHRKLPSQSFDAILSRLDQAVDDLIRQGVTDFISGGAAGFDLLAAMVVLSKKKMGKDLRLIFALPCRNQEAGWSPLEKERYRFLLEESDEVVYVSEEYRPGCMRKRNCYMVDRSAYCVSALLHERSGTAQTVAYARKKGLTVISVAD